MKELVKTKSNGILSRLLRNPFSSRRKEGQKERPKINRKEIYTLRPGTDPNYRLDTCCSPIPGDYVLGFVDDDECVIVHKVNCATAMRLKTAFGSRLVATRWEGKAEQFIGNIALEGLDRRGMLDDISQTLTRQMSVNVRALNIRADGEVFHADLTVRIDTTETLKSIITALKKVKGVKTVQRVD